MGSFGGIVAGILDRLFSTRNKAVLSSDEKENLRKAFTRASPRLNVSITPRINGLLEIGTATVEPIISRIDIPTVTNKTKNAKKENNNNNDDNKSDLLTNAQKRYDEALKQKNAG